jgi:hypothetical protein
MNFDWVEPLPDDISLLDAKLRDGRLRLEVEGAVTAHDKQAVERRFAVFGDVEVAARSRHPRRCVRGYEREPRRLALYYVATGDEHLDHVMVAEDDARVIVFGVMCAPEEQDLDQPERETRVHVYLEAPLGDRAVIDGFMGLPVPLDAPGWFRRDLDETDEWVHT